MAWFVHVARRRSFTKAAMEMEVTRATVSQHLKSLERHLNVRLINRTTRDMSLTEEGQRLFDLPRSKARSRTWARPARNRRARSGYPSHALPRGR